MKPQPNKRARLSEDSGPVVDSCGEATLSNASEPQTVDCAMKNEGDDSELKTERINSDQPILFTGGTLRKYQIEGYKWLQVKKFLPESSKSHCILKKSQANADNLIVKGWGGEI